MILLFEEKPSVSGLAASSASMRTPSRFSYYPVRAPQKLKYCIKSASFQEIRLWLLTSILLSQGPINGEVFKNGLVTD